MMTVWETVFSVLEEHGIDVYPPSAKSGECKSEYVVIKQDGSSQVGSFSSEKVYYQFMLYVPQNKYDILSQYEEKVKAIIDVFLYPLLMPEGSTIPDYYDDNVKAHMRSFLYRVCKRNKHL